MEFLRERIHITMRNRSIGGYATRQKINALITYALSKHPKWLIVEFYSGNDVPDVMVEEACERVNDIRCSTFGLQRAFMADPEYRTMLDVRPNSFAILDSYA